RRLRVALGVRVALPIRRALAVLAVQLVLARLQVVGAAGQRIQALLLAQLLQQLQAPLELLEHVLVLLGQRLERLLHRATIHLLQRLLHALHGILELLRLDVLHDLAHLSELRLELLLERLALGGLLQALAHVARGVVHLLRHRLLAVCGLLHLLRALERRTLPALGLRLALEPLGRLLRPARLLRRLLARSRPPLLPLLERRVEIGERGKADAILAAGGAAARARPRVVERHQAEDAALARQERQRGGVPARGRPGLPRLVVERGQRLRV